MVKIERMLMNNPIADPNDIEKYTLIDDVSFWNMETDYFADTSRFFIRIFCRKDATNNPYWDLYVWDCMLYPEAYHRFVIQDNLLMPINDEELFIKYTTNIEKSGTWNHREIEILLETVMPGVGLEYISGNIVGQLVQCAYYKNLPCVRGVLYKERLNVIAFNIDKIPDTNLIGNNPVSIIGRSVNPKILKILNNEDLVHILFTDEKLEKSIEIYKHFLGYFGDDLPNTYQCAYFQLIYESKNSDSCIRFNRALYRKLAEVRSWYQYNLYIRFMELREIIPIKFKIPTIDNLPETVSRLEIMTRYTTDASRLDKLFKIRSNESQFRYESGKYILRMPFDIFDICKEADEQGNCLLDCGYVEKHASGETTIVFIREKYRPAHSFVTMEIKENWITQLYGKYNSLPPRAVYEFVEKYARDNWLSFNPDELIYESVDFDCDEISEEIEDYLEEYHRRFYYTVPYVDDNNYIQLSFDDLYPGLFTTNNE